MRHIMANTKHVNKPINRHTLDNLSIKEIINKFPDKVISVEQRNRATYLQLDTCMIIFNSDFPRYSSSERLKKQLKNNKYN
jgi:hypothetical protein